MKTGDLRQFNQFRVADVHSGKIFLVVSARETLCDILVDGKLIQNNDLLYVKHNSRPLNETG